MIRKIGFGAALLFNLLNTTAYSAESGQALFSSTQIITALTASEKVLVINNVPREKYAFQKNGIYTVFGEISLTHKYFVKNSKICVYFDPNITKCWKVLDIKRDGSIAATSISDGIKVQFISSKGRNSR
jgi:hypothetical protein